MAYPRSQVTVTNKGPVVSGRISETMAQAQRKWLTGVLRTLRDDVRILGPRDTGAFARSVVYRTRRRGMIVEGEVYSTDSPDGKVAVIEFGRLPGRKMPPRGALLGWMARHGIEPRAEFLIRRKIARDGIPAVAPFRKAFRLRRGLLQSQARNLQSTLVTALNR